MTDIRTLVAVLLAFTSSFLLFSIQPVVGRIFLPFLGGSPAVWNTCMMFFQTLLLLGYLYSHVLSQKVKARIQPGWQFIVGALTLFILPIGLPVGLIDVSTITERPIFWLLFTLTATVGPCFFFLSCMSPLIQSWYHQVNPTKNPYALFAASNTGSLLALLAYPLFFEAAFPVSEQARLWSVAYFCNGLLLGVVAVYMFRVLKNRQPIAEENSPANLDDQIEVADELDIDQWTTARSEASTIWRQRAFWFFLAFIPSSLMLGVTSFLTTDVAAIPMLWLLPLALYLLTYIVAFGRYNEKSDKIFSAMLPIAVALLLFLIFAEYRKNLWLCMTSHLSLFFIIGLAVHGRLSLSKPAPKRLTEYYVLIAAGGMAGGILNALIAPQLFNVLAEYPIVAAFSLAILFKREHFLSARTPVLLVSAAASGVLLLYLSDIVYDKDLVGNWIPVGTFSIENSVIRTSLLYGIPLLLLAMFVRNGKLAAAGLIGFTLSAVNFEPDENVMLQERSVYGTVTVKRYSNPLLNSLVHGGILHGEQRIDSEEARLEPRSYYHREGPLGQVMDTLAKNRAHPRIAALGMGTGTIAAYGTMQNDITFYELDPNVVKIAQDPKYFTYVDDCKRRWCNLRVVVGDARLQIIQSPDTYDAVIVDAFSSDSIPVHLITKEAVENYLQKIETDGLLVFHISNRYVNLEPVLLGIAQKLGLGFALRTDEANDLIGKGASTWVVLSADMSMFEEFYEDPRWGGLKEDEKVGVWTDDYAALMKVFTWF
jgi:hypothetical protein